MNKQSDAKYGEKDEPKGSAIIVPLSRKRPSFGIRQPSRNRSGGRNSRKKLPD
jgi:hypothetical protein